MDAGNHGSIHRPESVNAVGRILSRWSKIYLPCRQGCRITTESFCLRPGESPRQFQPQRAGTGGPHQLAHGMEETQDSSK